MKKYAIIFNYDKEFYKAVKNMKKPVKQPKWKSIWKE